MRFFLLLAFATMVLLEHAPAQIISPNPAKMKPMEPVLAKDHLGPATIGVKLAISKVNGLPRVVGLTPGGPASDYGLELDDVIVKIDKNLTNSLTEDEINLALKGSPFSAVDLTVQRGDNPLLIRVAVARRVLPKGAEDIRLPAVNDPLLDPRLYPKN